MSKIEDFEKEYDLYSYYIPLDNNTDKTIKDAKDDLDNIHKKLDNIKSHIPELNKKRKIVDY